MDAGTYGEWVGGIGAIVAVIAALSTFRMQRKIDAQAREKSERDAAERARRDDLDATRQIVYMAILAYDSQEPLPVDVRAALANALTHHDGHILGASDAVILVNDLHWFTRGDTPDPPNELRRHFQNLARHLSDELGEDPAVWDLPPGSTLPVRHPDDPED